MTYRIMTAGPASIGRCASVLAEAFTDDPLMASIWRKSERRHAALGSYFATSLKRYHVPNGGVQYAVSESGEIGAVAVWDQPELWRQPVSTTLRALPALLPALRTRIPAAIRIRTVLDAHHPDAPIGIWPIWVARGKGATRALRRLC